MGLFEAIKSKKGVVLGAVVKGECVPIETVPDPVFSGEMLGKGMAFRPEEGRIYAPADGVVGAVFPTGHAVSITTCEGIEVLIHVGVDTVQLKGQYFKTQAAVKQNVKKGDLLLEADMEEIKKAGYDTTVVMVVCNHREFSHIVCQTEGKVMAGEDAMICMK